MTDAEMIARLRDSVNGEYDMTPHGADVLQAADRIETLIAERDALQAWKRYWSGEYDTVLAGRADEYDRAEAAEAKLAENEVRLGKAVEALEMYACDPECADGKCYDTGDSCGQFATATLAEIKGESHE